MMIWSKTEHHYSFSSNHVLPPRRVSVRIRRVLPRFLFRVTVVANSTELSCRWNEQLCVGDVGMMISLFFVQTTCEAKMKRRRSLWEVVNWVETMLCVYVCCMWSSRGKISRLNLWPHVNCSVRSSSLVVVYLLVSLLITVFKGRNEMFVIVP